VTESGGMHSASLAVLHRVQRRVRPDGGRPTKLVASKKYFLQEVCTVNLA